MVVEENGLAVKCKRGSGEEYVVENIYGVNVMKCQYKEVLQDEI